MTFSKENHKVQLSILLPLLFSLLSCGNTSHTQPASLEKQASQALIYNSDELTNGFSEANEKNKVSILKSSFIDGSVTDISYKGKPIIIGDCKDLLKYDLREVSNLVSTDRDLLLKRKRRCQITEKLSSTKLVFSEINKSNYYLKNIEPKKILESIKLDSSSVVCKEEQKKLVCDNRYENYQAHISPVMKYKNMTYYFVDVYSGRMPSFYTIEVQNSNIEVYWHVS